MSTEVAAETTNTLEDCFSHSKHQQEIMGKEDQEIEDETIKKKSIGNNEEETQLPIGWGYVTSNYVKPLKKEEEQEEPILINDETQFPLGWEFSGKSLVAGELQSHWEGFKFCEGVSYNCEKICDNITRDSNQKEKTQSNTNKCILEFDITLENNIEIQQQLPNAMATPDHDKGLLVHQENSVKEKSDVNDGWCHVTTGSNGSKLYQKLKGCCNMYEIENLIESNESSKSNVKKTEKNVSVNSTKGASKKKKQKKTKRTNNKENRKSSSGSTSCCTTTTTPTTPIPLDYDYMVKSKNEFKRRRVMFLIILMVLLLVIAACVGQIQIPIDRVALW